MVQLPKGIIDIEFTKTDGTVRKMKCTIDPEIIGDEVYTEFVNKTNKDGSPRKRPDHITSIYDLESNSWKCFISENLISVNGVNTAIKGEVNE